MDTGLLVGPIAALILISGNVGVILALFPTHVAWTVYTLLKYVSSFSFQIILFDRLFFHLPGFR